MEDEGQRIGSGCYCKTNWTSFARFDSNKLSFLCEDMLMSHYYLTLLSNAEVPKCLTGQHNVVNQGLPRIRSCKTTECDPEAAFEASLHVPMSLAILHYVSTEL